MKLRIITALAVGGTLALLSYPRMAGRQALPAGVLVERVLTHVEDRYVDEVDRDQLLRGGLDLMVQQLDRNTRYVKPDEVEAFDSETEGQFVGLGVVLEAPREGYPHIQSVIAGGPAEVAGILPDDMILEVNRVDVEGISLDDLHERLHGSQGTVVTLTIRRGARERRQFKVPLDRVTISAIGAVRLYDDGAVSVGYVRLNQFSRGTAQDCEQAFHNLAADGAKALILDLRENSGGVLGEGIAVAGQFLREGVILRTRGREKEEKEYEADEPGPFPARPLVVTSTSPAPAPRSSWRRRCRIITARCWSAPTVTASGPCRASFPWAPTRSTAC